MTRLAYLGTPALAVPPLEALVRAGHQIELVVSGADRRRGRGSGTSASQVKAAAQALGLATADGLGPLREMAAVPGAIELGVVVAYGRLIARSVLDVLPMVNVHFSLLPRWRGAAPVERAILAGDRVTGVCLMALEEGLDTGPVYRRREVAIGADEHLGPLRDRLVDLGSAMVVELLANGLAGLGVPEPQSGEATYAKKIDPGELELHWNATRHQLLATVRLDRAYTTAAGRRLGVLTARPCDPELADAPAEPGTLVGERVAAIDGWIELLVVQPEGRRPMAARDWRRGTQAAGLRRLGEEVR
jgi:methionyl-tRNA formyltransferase